MNSNDEEELRRLCCLLESIQTQFAISSSQLEALRKSAFGLHIMFLAGQRERIEALDAENRH
jgi:hypothetical protein